MYCTMDNAGRDEVILLAAVILQWQRLCGVDSSTEQGVISQNQTMLVTIKMLRLALEYVINCQSGVLFVAFGCLEGQILMKDLLYKVTYSFWLCMCMKCLTLH